MPGMVLKFNQPELWLLTGNVNLKRHLSGPSVMQDQCNYSQCVFLLTFNYGQYHAKRQRGKPRHVFGI